MTSPDLFQRLRRYLDATDVPPDIADRCLKETGHYLERSSSRSDPKVRRRAAFKFLRSAIETASAPVAIPIQNAQRPITRSFMTYREYSKTARDDERRLIKKNAPTPWKRRARNRRALLLILLLVAMSFGVVASSTLFSGDGIPALKIPIILVFSFLFAWVALNCITSLFGFLLFCRGRDPLNPADVLKDDDVRISPDTTVAVLLPIYNEEVAHIFAGLRVMYESLQATSHARHFTFFILSDTQEPDVWVNEEVAWQKFCDDYPTDGRIVYRHRKSRIGRKSGNVADFCRRWGKQFRYMIVLDSDSLLNGRTMVQLATVMDARPDIGILQTAPLNFNAKTLLGRLQQFTSQAYGPLFLMGLHYWQLGDASYWGHNAILRVAPFMTYCALPKTRGRLPLGGMILSHDSIEAALMRRAGWGVWLAYDLPGSFEQPPSTLNTELSRDARWCRGNIQHLRYLGLQGLTLGHRWLFLNGNFFYGASFLWMVLLILVTTNSVAKLLWSPNFFPLKQALFPQWPIEHRELNILLLSVTILYLFLPKCLAVISTASHRKTRERFGGLSTLIVSALIELVCSSLFAPLRMILHSYHVLTSWSGRRFDWHVSSRSTTGITFWDALKLGGIPTLIGLVSSFCLYHFDRTLFGWTSVVFIPLIFSVPFAIGISHGGVGEFFRRRRWLRVPTETDPSREIIQYESFLKYSSSAIPVARYVNGFVAAVLDPKVHRLHIRILRNERHFHSSVEVRRTAIADDAVRQGPKRLSARHKREILYDPRLLARLHEDVWSLPEHAFSQWVQE